MYVLQSPTSMASSTVIRKASSQSHQVEAIFMLSYLHSIWKPSKILSHQVTTYKQAPKSIWQSILIPQSPRLLYPAPKIRQWNIQRHIQFHHLKRGYNPVHSSRHTPNQNCRTLHSHLEESFLSNKIRLTRYIKNVRLVQNFGTMWYYYKHDDPVHN